MDSGERISRSWGCPASSLMAFKSSAAEAPKRLLVFPVIIRPSGSSRAAAGAPVCSARTRAAATTCRSAVEMPAWFIKSSSFWVSSSMQFPLNKELREAK